MLHAIQTWLGHTAIAPFMRDSVWGKPVLESSHILADALVLFSAGLIATRLLTRPKDAAETVRRFAPWLWSGFAAAAVTGLMLLTAAGRRGLENPMFQIKLGVLAGALCLTAAIQGSLARDAGFWGAAPARRWAAALIGPLCLLLWLATVFAGRLLAYSTVFFAPQY
jgi:hypothetical protein